MKKRALRALFFNILAWYSWSNYRIEPRLDIRSHDIVHLRMVLVGLMKHTFPVVLWDAGINYCILDIDSPCLKTLFDGCNVHVVPYSSKAT